MEIHRLFEKVGLVINVDIFCLISLTNANYCIDLQSYGDKITSIQ